uniref:Titin n=1 Tax=Syphacia muris TaxID=451379 RepID=A0A0N5AZX4_9BILA
MLSTSFFPEDAVLPAEVIDIPVTHDNQQKETAESKEIAPEPPEPVEVSPIPPTKKPKPPERSSKKRLKKNKSVDNPDTKKQSQNEHEKLSAKKTSTTVKNKATEAPVPGTWIGPTQEINISHNKRLERDQSLSLENVTAIKPIQDVSHAEPVKILLEKKKKEFMETFADHKFQLQCVQKAVLINYPIKQYAFFASMIIFT